MRRGRLKDTQMCSLIKFNMKTTYDAPSGWKHPKSTTSINLDQSSHMTKRVLEMLKFKRKVHTTKKVLKMFKYKRKEPEYKRKVHMAKKVLKMFKDKRKDPQFKRKTSSGSDTDQDEDLAVPEGLNPREGITGYHALPVLFIARQPSRAEL